MITLVAMGVAVWSLLEVKKSKEELRDLRRQSDATAFELKIHRGK